MECIGLMMTNDTTHYTHYSHQWTLIVQMSVIIGSLNWAFPAHRCHNVITITWYHQHKQQMATSDQSTKLILQSEYSLTSHSTHIFFGQSVMQLNVYELYLKLMLTFRCTFIFFCIITCQSFCLCGVMKVFISGFRTTSMRSFQTRVFPGNQLCWYWPTNKPNNAQKQKNKPSLTVYLTVYLLRMQL